MFRKEHFLQWELLVHSAESISVGELEIQQRERVDSASCCENRGLSIEKYGTQRVRGDHSDPQAGGSHCNQRIIRSAGPVQFSRSSCLAAKRASTLPVWVQSLRFGTRIRLALSKSRSNRSNACRSRGASPAYSSFQYDRTQPNRRVGGQPPQRQGVLVSRS
jgi:hypothetical protein